MLAYAMADGGVGLLRVAQMLEAPPAITGFVAEYDRDENLHVSVEPLRELAFSPDKRAITALQWINVPGRNVSPSRLKKKKRKVVHSSLLATADSRCGQARHRAPLVPPIVPHSLARNKDTPGPDAKIVGRIVLFRNRFGLFIHSSPRHPPHHIFGRILPRDP